MAALSSSSLLFSSPLLSDGTRNAHLILIPPSHSHSLSISISSTSMPMPMPMPAPALNASSIARSSYCHHHHHHHRLLRLSSFPTAPDPTPTRIALAPRSPLPPSHRIRRQFLTHATTEEIQLEKSKVEGAAKDKMDKALDAVQSSFNTVRTGRSSPAMLDRIEVEYYGTPVGLNTIAQISTPDGSSLLVQPYDKSSLKEIEKAIVKSNLGLTPTNDGQAIRINVPQPTAERRKELLKVVGKLTEEGKVAIRNIRRDAIKAYDKLEKEKKLSKDNVKDLSDDIQKLTDQYIKKVESLQREKEKEIMTV